MKERSGWTIWIGTPEEIEAKRRDYWRSLTHNERLQALAKIRAPVLGTHDDRLARTDRIVEVPRR